MKIIILGAGGMLGHLAGCYFKEKYPEQVVLAARRMTGASFLDEGMECFDLLDRARLEALIAKHRPCVVINCAAVNDPVLGEEVLMAVNGGLPHAIAEIIDSRKDGSRLIQISTDGVFRGDRGGYSEKDIPDAQDLYGRSKLAGEVTYPPHLTVRTSIVGPDPFHGRGLMAWFLSQEIEAKGFARVFWNGVTTLELVRFLDHTLQGNSTGLYHLCSEKMSKYELLGMIRDVFISNTLISRDEAPVSDRTLVNLRRDGDYEPPDTRRMIEALRIWILEHPNIYPSKDFRSVSS